MWNRLTASQKAGRWGLFEALHFLRNRYPGADFQWPCDFETNERSRRNPSEPEELDRFELRTHMIQAKCLARVNHEFTVHMIKVEGVWVVTSVNVWSHPNVYGHNAPSSRQLSQHMLLQFVYRNTNIGVYLLDGIVSFEHRVDDRPNRWLLQRRSMSA